MQPKRPVLPQGLDLSVYLGSTFVSCRALEEDGPGKSPEGKGPIGRTKASKKGNKSTGKEAKSTAASPVLLPRPGGGLSALTYDADDLQGEYALNLAKRPDRLVLQELLAAHTRGGCSFMNITDTTFNGMQVSLQRLEELADVPWAAPKSAAASRAAAPGSGTARSRTQPEKVQHRPQDLVQMRVAAAARMGELFRTRVPTGLLRFAAALLAGNAVQETWKV
jgi:hypothetical protein